MTFLFFFLPLFSPEEDKNEDKKTAKKTEKKKRLKRIWKWEALKAYLLFLHFPQLGGGKAGLYKK